MAQSGFFDVKARLARLSGLGDQPEALCRTVDFKVFRPKLDTVLMFRILAIQTLNNFSDERTEYLISAVWPSRAFWGWACRIVCLTPK